MSLFEELQKGAKARPRLYDYLRWAVLAVLVAIALVAVVILVLLALAGESATEFIESLLHHAYIHYGLIPVLVLLIVTVVALLAWIVQLVFTYVVYWKAYSEKRGASSTESARPDLLQMSKAKAGWSKGYYQGIILLATNVILVVFIVAGIIYTLGYVGIDVAEQPAFCTMCHEVMDPPYQSYLASSHKGIHCGACHNDPGVKGFVKGEVIAPMKEGWLQVAEEYHLDEPFLVPINNHSCMNGECHKEDRLMEEEFRHGNMVYRHKKHMNLKLGGHELSCDACHAYDDKVHMAIDYRVCSLCHFSKNYSPTENLECSACHAARPRLEKPLDEQLHREVADFEHHACIECHELAKEDIVIQEDSCTTKCHHHHGGEDKELAENENIHALHKDAKCMSCHTEVEHKIGVDKFRSMRRTLFGREFVHKGHFDMPCTECHAEKDGHFVVKMKTKTECNVCHHRPDKIEGKKCSTCHKKAYRPQVFGKQFSHESHGSDCAACHNQDLTLKLEDRTSCNACHHEGADDPEMCSGCHDSQDSFYRGTEGFGVEAVSSTKADSEMGCDTCHADMPKYNPANCKAVCTECHEGAGEEYEYDKLVAKGKKSIDTIVKLLNEVNDKFKIKQKTNSDSGFVADAGKMLEKASGIAGLLKKDGSVGIHNPAQFKAYVDKATKLLKAAKTLLEQ